MSPRGYLAIVCDACALVSPLGPAGETVPDARARLAGDGWRRLPDGTDRCPGCVIADHKRLTAEGGAR